MSLILEDGVRLEIGDLEMTLSLRQKSDKDNKEEDPSCRARRGLKRLMLRENYVEDKLIFELKKHTRVLLSSRSKNSISEMTNGSEYVSPVRSPEMIGNRRGSESEGLGFNLCVAPSRVVVSLISRVKDLIGDQRSEMTLS